jgi:hypothetical protein
MGVDACMLLKLKRDFSDAEILSIAVNACERFGDVFFVFRGFKEDKKDAHHCVYRVTEYDQDGDTLYPEPGETFLECSLYGRYYGEGIRLFLQAWSSTLWRILRPRSRRPRVRYVPY